MWFYLSSSQWPHAKSVFCCCVPGPENLRMQRPQNFVTQQRERAQRMKPTSNYHQPQAIYRGLALSPSAGEELLVAPSSVARKSPTPPQPPALPNYPFVQLPSESKFVIFNQGLSILALEEKLKQCCTSVRLVRNDTLCVFHCIAECKDGKSEQVDFSVHVWAVPGAGCEQSFLEVTRKDGCPFLLSQVLSEACLSSSAQADCSGRGLFRVPKLPACLEDSCCETVGGECVAKILTLCLGEDFEQRKQALKIVADLTEDNARVTKLFCAAQAPQRLQQQLASDRDACVRKLVNRIATNCSTKCVN